LYLLLVKKIPKEYLFVYYKRKDQSKMTTLFRCENCDYTTPQKYRYNRHVKNKNGCKTKILCKYCPKKMTTPVTYKKHLKSCPYKKKCLCKHCGNTLSKVANLNQHLRVCKENPLSPKYSEFSSEITKNQCPYCNNYLRSKEDLCIHIKICPEFDHEDISLEQIQSPPQIFPNAQTVNNDQSTTNNNDHSTTNNNTTNNNNSVNHITNNTTNNNTTINNNNKITANIIFNFGGEDLSYITSSALRQCYLNPRKSIPKLVEYVHFNKSHPENSNIKIDGDNGKHVKIYDGNTWNYSKMKPALENIANKNFQILEKRVGECLDNMTFRAKENWEDFYYGYLGDEPLILDSVHDGLVVLLKKHTDK